MPPETFPTQEQRIAALEERIEHLTDLVEKLAFALAQALSRVKKDS